MTSPGIWYKRYKIIEEFEAACDSNDLDQVKLLEIPDDYTLNHAFETVCKKGNLDIAKYLYEQGAEIKSNKGYEYDGIDGNIYDTIVIASKSGHLNIIQWLYELGITDKNDRAFQYACLYGHFHIAQWLYSMGANITDKYNIAFTDACRAGHLHIAEWLYSLGVTDKDNIAFIETCGTKHLHIAKWLYQLGSSDKNSAFIWACYKGQKHVAQWLYDLGVDISAENNHAFRHVCECDNIDIAKWLYGLGVDISDKFAFIGACSCSCIDIVKWLIDIHFKSAKFIYFRCYEYFKLEIKELLIDYNLVHPRQLNERDLEHYLARTNRIVPADFDHPNTHKRGQRTKPAPKYFFLNLIYNFKMRQAFFKYYESDFKCVCMSGDLEQVKTYKIPDFNTLNSAFISVCMEGYLDIAKYLFENGADISCNFYSAFINTCRDGHLDVAQWMHGLGIKDNIVYVYAFVNACQNGRLHVAKWLCELQPHDINFAFIEACYEGHLNVAQWLYESGADISAKNNNAFLDACNATRIDIVKWLIDIHYKLSGFIHFKNYHNFKLEIKELLIEANLVHPSQLNTADLEHYLARTKGLVPSDFDHPNTHKRGQRTKPAPK